MSADGAEDGMRSQGHQSNIKKLWAALAEVYGDEGEEFYGKLTCNDEKHWVTGLKGLQREQLHAGIKHCKTTDALMPQSVEMFRLYCEHKEKPTERPLTLARVIERCEVGVRVAGRRSDAVDARIEAIDRNVSRKLANDLKNYGKGLTMEIVEQAVKRREELLQMPAESAIFNLDRDEMILHNYYHGEIYANEYIRDKQRGTITDKPNANFLAPVDHIRKTNKPDIKSSYTAGGEIYETASNHKRDWIG